MANRATNLVLASVYAIGRHGRIRARAILIPARAAVTAGQGGVISVGVPMGRHVW
jgi:hypothetical protein